MTVEELPPYSKPLEFENKPIALCGAKTAKHMRIMNVEKTLDYMFITHPNDNVDTLDFHIHSDSGPVIFTIKRMDNAPTFKITDHRLNEHIIISRYCYTSGEKHQFKINGVEYSWKQDGPDYKLLQYPSKQVIGNMKMKSKDHQAYFDMIVGNTFEFTVQESEVYHFAWLTGFAVNWEYSKRRGTAPV